MHQAPRFCKLVLRQWQLWPPSVSSSSASPIQVATVVTLLVFGGSRVKRTADLQTECCNFNIVCSLALLRKARFCSKLGQGFDLLLERCNMLQRVVVVVVVVMVVVVVVVVVVC